ncbi:hypothetical protein ABDD95_09580 [Mucilaginibacter sp. PAMB04274]|uniref:hypothetical protein n=1 Tax=Mucilaginibacter sp. PAMB04274 TaxID=3138568 RepID=UPI0031F5F58D
MKDNSDTTPVVQPQGKFTGQFYRIHRNANTQVKDTVKAEIVLDLVSNTFKVTGDTTKHAGSNGKFNYNQSYMEWIDSTVPIGSNSLNLPKYHLHGLYQYVYNGTNLEFAASTYPVDTLIYLYKLKK